MVDVTKDGDHGRPRLELGRVDVLPEHLLRAGRLDRLGGLLGNGSDLLLGPRLDTELVRNEGGRLEVDGLVDRRHDAHVHQTADDVDHAQVERAGEVANCD